LSDFERPLKRRGREAAQLVGERLAQEKLKNPVLICSPAVRTRETAELVLKSSKLRVEERWDERIYEASLRDLLQVVSDIPDDKKVAIIIGHNPGFEELLAFLTGESRRMPTAALAKILFDVSWKDIEARSGKLDWFVTPKELAAE
jgi:phosphohistidine phosphatase